jgi:hypothetical protein
MGTVLGYETPLLQGNDHTCCTVFFLSKNNHDNQRKNKIDFKYNHGFDDARLITLAASDVLP